MKKHGIQAIDLVVVNLYPFQSAIAADPDNFDNAIENIDVGGPSMIRAAAKNVRWACVVVNPADYLTVSEEIKLFGGISMSTRMSLAIKAFSRLSEYDASIAAYLAAAGRTKDTLPEDISLFLEKHMPVRYGENPHQNAAFYKIVSQPERSRLVPVQIQGKSLSFNNISDADAAIECIREFDKPACVIIKHATPCGVALSEDLTDAYQRAFETDTASAFGGIIAFSRKVQKETAQRLVSNQVAEIVAAPGYDDGALRVLATHKSMRVLRFKARDAGMLDDWVYTSVSGGMLIQARDDLTDADIKLQVVTERSPDDAEMSDLLFAWKVVKHVKSNAIVLVCDKATTGIGAGQMSRVDSARIAVRKAADAGFGERRQVVASDAFMPFSDALEVAVEFGAKAVIQPGGSIADDKIIEFANQHGVAMVFTGIRHFRH